MVLASAHATASYCTGSRIALVLVGLLLVALGLAMFAGSFISRVVEWNNTHDRGGKPTPHVSRGQSTYNVWAARFCGLIALAGGTASLLVGVGVMHN